MGGLHALQEVEVAVQRHPMQRSRTVGVATVLDADEVLVIITGTHKAYALAKCIEEGVNHMFTVSAIQMHPKAIVVCDEDATLDDRERFEAQAALVLTAIDRIDDAIGGSKFRGYALDDSGLRTEGTYVVVGPSQFFRSADGCE